VTHAIGHAEYRTERHGRWGSGRARAAIFGLSDGLVSNMGLVAGIAGASEGADAVLVGGVAGLVAGACSMAVGEYVSMKANRELAARELAIERREIVSDPAGETRELAGIYVERGVAPADADHVAAIMMADPERALETHAREELGIDPDELGAPVGAAAASFAAFALGAAIPLLPWVLARGSETSTALIAASLTLGLLAAFVLGALIGRRTGHGIVRTGLRQVGWAAAAFAATYAIGTALGTAV
jgi:VIT1/CCC1 family predicted Fe2+/Mn2+ transporter